MTILLTSDSSLALGMTILLMRDSWMLRLRAA
jgi:hypothetical protein